MTKDVFQVNLPVENIINSKIFYSKLGFNVHGVFHDKYAMFYIGQMYIGINLIFDPEFKRGSLNEISGTKKGIGAFFDIELESKEELYEFANNVKNAGGIIYEGPDGVDGELTSHWLKFADIDGHLWSVKYQHVDLS